MFASPNWTLSRALLFMTVFFLVPTVLILLLISQSLIHHEAYFSTTLQAIDGVRSAVSECYIKMTLEMKRADECQKATIDFENQLNTQIQDLWNLTQEVTRLESSLQDERHKITIHDNADKKREIEFLAEKAALLEEHNRDKIKDKDAMVNIVVPVLDSRGLKNLHACLFSIQQHTTPLIPTQIIVLHPDSLDPIQAIMDAQQQSWSFWDSTEDTINIIQAFAQSSQGGYTSTQGEKQKDSLKQGKTRPEEALENDISSLQISIYSRISLAHTLKNTRFVPVDINSVKVEDMSLLRFIKSATLSLSRLINSAKSVLFQSPYVAFISPSVVVHPNWLEHLLRPFESDKSVGIVTGLACQYSMEEKENKIFSAGLEIILDGDTPKFHSKFRGHSLKYLKANLKKPEIMQPPSTISFPSPLLMRSDVIQAAGSFNDSLCAHEFQDIALRISHKSNHSIVFSPKSKSQLIESKSKSYYRYTTTDYSWDDDYASESYGEPCKLGFHHLWGSLLKQEIETRHLSQSTLVWDLYCGCTGFNVEAINYLVPLERVMKVRSVAYPSCFCDGFPIHFQEALERTTKTPLNENYRIIWVSHKPPDAHPKFPYKGNLFFPRRPDYVIGRTMTEVDLLQPGWAELCNNATYFDEIWVPSKHSMSIFIENGVHPNRLHRIPESLDVYLYDPKTTQIMPSDDNDSSSFNFLSIFKWETRKGWEILLNAYFSEFTADDDVSLTLHTYLYGESSPRDPNRVRQKIETFAQEEGFNITQLPKVIINCEEVETWKMPRIYKSAHAFVLPTRGEGWGLPIMEAMSMELPVIATAWGGNMDFMNENNSYPIEVEELVEAHGKEFPMGSKWAQPSLRHLRHLMRHVYRHRREARAIGRKARETIVEHFSQEAVRDVVLARLREIEAILDMKQNT